MTDRRFAILWRIAWATVCLVMLALITLALETKAEPSEPAPDRWTPASCEYPRAC